MMLQNVLDHYRALNEGRRAAQQTLKEGLAELERSYKGELLQQKQQELKKAYTQLVSDLETEHIPPIRQNFSETKQTIQQAVTKPIPDDLMKMIQAFHGLNLSDNEKRQILESVKNNYAARKRAVELLELKDDDLPPSLNTVLDNLDYLEKFIDKSFQKDLDSYPVRLIEHGTWVERVQAECNQFNSTYNA